MLPILDYCSCVWDPHLSGNVNKLEKVQTFAARLVTGKWSEGSEKLREELSWPLLTTRRSFQKLSLCRRILNGHSLIPDTVFPPNTSSHLRHPNSRPLNFARTNYHKHSFFVSVIELWNALPEDIVSSDTVSAFKRHLKSYLCM